MTLVRGSCASGDRGGDAEVVCAGVDWMEEEAIDGGAVSVDEGGLAVLLVEEMLRLVFLPGDTI